MKILFVCTGNTCRSPLAEVLAASPDREVRSRGLAAYEGDGASLYAIDAAAELGFDLSGHKARLVSADDMLWADAVYGMTQEHAAALRSFFPEHADKVKMLPGGDIPDPVGGELSEYRACAARLREDIKAL